MKQRQDWFDGQCDLDPERLVFIDETWTATNMTRSHGRCARGERLRMGFPHGHRKTTTLVAGLRMTGMVAPMVLDGPINGDWFEGYVAQVLVPELRPGDVVLMDNLAAHKVAGVDLLFSTTGKTPVSGFSKEKIGLDESAGIGAWWLHDLRRTMASGMARLGVSLPVIEKILNHSSGSFRGVVGVYQRHSFADEKRAALDLWGAHVARLVA